jgi:hypothetical protein
MSGTTSDKPTGDKPVTSVPNNAGNPSAGTPNSTDKSAPSQRVTTATAPPQASSTSPGAPAASAAQRTLKCPKCGTNVREVARFCQRCHHTMRYECPSCHNQQRIGGKCEKCGIDFLKYIGAVVTQKQVEADAIHERLEQRSTLMKNILWMLFTLGYPIIRDYFIKRDRKK